MFGPTPLLSALPSGVLDMTADFAPLFVGMVVVLGLSVLGVMVAIGVHDSRRGKRQAKTASRRPDSTPHLPEIA